MMEKNRMQPLVHLVAGLMIVALAGCSAGTKLVDSWRTDRPIEHKPEKVAVIVALPDGLTRQAIEIDVAEFLRGKGIPAIAGSNLSGLSGGIRGEIDTDSAAEILRRNGVDGVVVSFYAGGGRSGEYVRANYHADYAGTGVGYYGYSWGHPYFVDVYTVHKVGDIQNFTITTYIETAYYDLGSRESVWRIVTQTNDVEHTDAAKDIAGKIAAQMKSAGLN